MAMFSQDYLTGNERRDYQRRLGEHLRGLGLINSQDSTASTKSWDIETNIEPEVTMDNVYRRYAEHFREIARRSQELAGPSDDDINKMLAEVFPRRGTRLPERDSTPSHECESRTLDYLMSLAEEDRKSYVVGDDIKYVNLVVGPSLPAGITDENTLPYQRRTNSLLAFLSGHGEITSEFKNALLKHLGYTDTPNMEIWYAGNSYPDKGNLHEGLKVKTVSVEQLIKLGEGSEQRPVERNQPYVPRGVPTLRSSSDNGVNIPSE